MAFTFSAADAQTLLTVFFPFVLPFVIRYIKQDGFSKSVNLAIAVVVSVLAGALACYAGGTLTNEVSVVTASALIFAQAQAHYATWFEAIFEPAPVVPPTE